MAISIALKYNDTAFIPYELIKGNNNPNQEYTLATGEVVRFEYIRGIDNYFGDMTSELEKECQSVYNMPFEKVYYAWKMRLGNVGTCWFTVNLVKVKGKK